ncbi:hypothetical protein D3C78_1304140 [compost metagenome]
MLEQETGDHRHNRNTATHRQRRINRLQPDHFRPLARSDKTHRCQMANGKGATVQNLDHQQPPQLGATGHQAPAQYPATGGKQQQIARIPAAEQEIAAGKNNHFGHHAQRPQVTNGRSRVARLLPIDRTETVITGMRALQQSDAQQEAPDGPFLKHLPQRTLGFAVGTRFPLRHHARFQHHAQQHRQYADYQAVENGAMAPDGNHLPGQRRTNHKRQRAP